MLECIVGKSAGFIRRGELPGVRVEHVLASIPEDTIGRLCELALSHECDALEQRLRAPPEDEQAADAPTGDADSDGRACGASFCGFYDKRDIFTWAEHAEPSSHASRAVLDARRAIELAIQAAGYEVGGAPARCEAWLNVLRHGDFLRLHDHAGALLSGVCWLYVPLDAAADGSRSERPWWSGAFLAASQSDCSTIEYCVVRARERWCAFFPGALHHAVLPFYSPDDDRGAPPASERLSVSDRGSVRRLLGDDWGRVRISLSFNYLSAD